MSISFLVSLIVPNLANGSLPAIEWSYSKQKGGETPNAIAQQQIGDLQTMIANMQYQLMNLQQQGVQTQEKKAMNNLAPYQTTMDVNSYKQNAPMFSGQQFMSGLQPVPQAMPMMAQPVPMIMGMMMPMETGRGLFSQPLELLKNMSLTVTPISKMISHLSNRKARANEFRVQHGESGSGYHDKGSKNRDYSVTKIKEVYTPKQHTSVTKTLNGGSGGCHSGSCHSGICSGVNCPSRCINGSCAAQKIPVYRRPGEDEPSNASPPIPNVNVDEVVGFMENKDPIFEDDRIYGTSVLEDDDPSRGGTSSVISPPQYNYEDESGGPLARATDRVLKVIGQLNQADESFSV
eukprot:GHVH01010212.1.p1 GENE.GHVH01010212.1~~GHVH01010212.1.p1  ORF type:complete len:348 (-),score=46.58 GHVH01010212.1:172-1215(-)